MSNILLKPLLKYPGGKSSEYKHLKKFFPQFDTYVEPFIGGGAVYWASNADKWFINDFSEELISLYKYTESQDELFLNYLRDISIMWSKKADYVSEIEDAVFEQVVPDDKLLLSISNDLLELVDKLPKKHLSLSTYLYDSILRKRKSLAKISKKETIKNKDENALGVLGSALYTYLRSLYNHTSFELFPELKTALYLFIREYAYSSMFRFNADGLFNVPFGGNTYAKKDFSHRLNQITDIDVITKLKNTTITQGDFSKAIIDKENTFMFLDPPYDSEFSTYNLHVFDAKEQIRLRDVLLNIKKTKWLMVVKSTEFVEDLYEREGWYKFRFDKSYSVNFKNRNSKDVKHLIITNYNLEDSIYGDFGK